MRATILRFACFALVGVSGLLVDNVALYLLHDPRSLALSLAPSKLLASLVALLNNFIWNDRWTFRGAARAPWFQRYMRYNMICALGVSVHLCLLGAFVGLMNMNYLAANVVSLPLVALINFTLNARLNWRVSLAPSE